MKLFWLIVLIIIIVIIVKKNSNKTVTPPAPTMPYPLGRIRFVRVDYVNWRNKKDRGTLEYAGTVSWSPYLKCWEIFIDNCTFADTMIEKTNYRFLDENKNLLPMQGFSFSEGDLIEGDCGYLKIYKTS